MSLEWGTRRQHFSMPLSNEPNGRVESGTGECAAPGLFQPAAENVSGKPAQPSKARTKTALAWPCGVKLTFSTLLPGSTSWERTTLTAQAGSGVS